MLTAVIVYLLYVKGKKKYIIPYIVSYLMIMPIVISCSLQFSTCYYLMSIFSIVILLTDGKNRLKIEHLFLVFGIATSFFDFLTYPLITFGVPAVFYLILNEEENNTKTVKIFKLLTVWFIGYVLMWSCKWVIASLLTSENVIAEGLDSVVFRISNVTSDSSAEKITIIKVIQENLTKFLYTPFSLLLFIEIVFYYLKSKKSNITDNNMFIPFIFLALLPLLWYGIIKNHSMIHAYFTNKALMVSSFALTSMLVSSIENKDYGQKSNSENNI